MRSDRVDFSAQVDARNYSKVLVFDRHLNDVSHERSTRRVNADGFEHGTLQLNLSGQRLVETQDNRLSVDPGQIVAFDMTKP
ncbi:hypothetical protein ACQQ2Q_02805 [Agrobacterium sp. ES01]|uniref:hypothetical protein n=1 Tax=Agrobacterium sp. ES01 TaxID=3420714 RepID=UPI003D1032E2